MPAAHVAQEPRVDLEGVDAVPDQGEAVPFESVGERLDPGRLSVDGFFRQSEVLCPGVDVFRQ